MGEVSPLKHVGRCIIFSAFLHDSYIMKATVPKAEVGIAVNAYIEHKVWMFCM